MVPSIGNITYHIQRLWRVHAIVIGTSRRRRETSDVVRWYDIVGDIIPEGVVSCSWLATHRSCRSTKNRNCNNISLRRRRRYEDVGVRRVVRTTCIFQFMTMYCGNIRGKRGHRLVSLMPIAIFIMVGQILNTDSFWHPTTDFKAGKDGGAANDVNGDGGGGFEAWSGSRWWEMVQ